jgi:UDPglucose 6-dehydrogenase
MGVTNVCVIGAGHVGAPHAIMLAKKCPGVTVRVFDMDKRKIAAWNSSLLPFYEPSMQEMLEDVRGQNLFFTNDAEAAIRSAEMVFVSVSTPLKEGGIGAGYAPDLVNWEKIARMIASASNCPKIIVERSTVPVRTAGAMAKVLGFNTDHQMTVLSNPEFARQGVAITDIASPERVMIGGEQTPEGLRAIGALADLYAQWVPREKIIVSDLWSAELAKLAANAFLAQRISSINAISALCEKTNADVSEVAYAVGVDTRVGRKNLQAGVGFGGVCYETHLRNLIYLCRSRRLPQVG